MKQKAACCYNHSWGPCSINSVLIIFLSYHCNVFNVFPPEKAMCILNLEEVNCGGKLGDLSCLAISESHCVCSQGTVIDVWQKVISFLNYVNSALLSNCFLIILCLMSTHCSSCSIFMWKTYGINCKYAASGTSILLSEVPWYISQFSHPLKALCLSFFLPSFPLPDSPVEILSFILARANWQKHNLNCFWVYNAN